MKRKTLASLSMKGGLTAIFEVSKTVDSDFVKNLASSLAGERPFLVLNFAKGTLSHDSPISLDSLFTEFDFTTQKNLEARRIQSAFIDAGASLDLIEGSDNNVRAFLKNVVFLRKLFPEIFVVFNASSAEKFKRILPSCEVLVFDVKSAEDADAVLNMQVLKDLDCTRVWHSNLAIPVSLKKWFAESASYIPSGITVPELAKRIFELRQIWVLKKNRPEGLAYSLSRMWPAFAILLLLLPLSIPFSVKSSQSMIRDMRHDRNAISEAPYFEYEFDGNESLRRIARYSVGRFHAQITSPTLVANYIAETLNKNSYAGDIKKVNDDFILPAGTRLKFYPMDSIKAAPDSVILAWQYFSGMLSDSVAYLTEFYDKNGSKGRKHNGIDVASRRGARILAPFAARAWTFEDERGGVVLALVHKKSVILFMHCDQLLYLDGQTVMAGDPVATVGVTGHTTGPHAHVVTGEVTPRGEKSVGGIHYTVIDPVSWYNKFIKNK